MLWARSAVFSVDQLHELLHYLGNELRAIVALDDLYVAFLAVDLFKQELGHRSSVLCLESLHPAILRIAVNNCQHVFVASGRVWVTKRGKINLDPLQWSRGNDGLEWRLWNVALELQSLALLTSLHISSHITFDANPIVIFIQGIACGISTFPRKKLAVTILLLLPTQVCTALSIVVIFTYQVPLGRASLLLNKYFSVPII